MLSHSVLPGSVPGFCPVCGKSLSLPMPSASSGQQPPVAAANGRVASPPSNQFPVGSLVKPALPGPAARPGAPSAAAVSAEAASPPRRRKHLMADLTVDSRHISRRETGRTLLMLGVFIVAAGLCAVVFHLMTGWGTR